MPQVQGRLCARSSQFVGQKCRLLLHRQYVHLGLASYTARPVVLLHGGGRGRLRAGPAERQRRVPDEQARAEPPFNSLRGCDRVLTVLKGAEGAEGFCRGGAALNSRRGASESFAAQVRGRPACALPVLRRRKARRRAGHGRLLPDAPRVHDGRRQDGERLQGPSQCGQSFNGHGSPCRKVRCFRCLLPVGWSDLATFKTCVALRVPHCGSAPRRYCESCVCIDSTLLLAGYSPRIQKPIGAPRARQNQKYPSPPVAAGLVSTKARPAFRGFAIGARCCRVLLRLQVRRECVVSGRQGRRCAHGNAVRHSWARGKLVRTNTGAELELECTSAGQQLRVPVYSGFLVCAAAALDCPARH